MLIKGYVFLFCPDIEDFEEGIRHKKICFEFGVIVQLSHTSIGQENQTSEWMVLLNNLNFVYCCILFY
jgi:hypothetical protein